MAACHDTCDVHGRACVVWVCRYGDLCWSGAKPDFQDLGSIFPDAKIKFFGGGELTLAAYRYMFQLSRKGTYCLAVFDNGDAGSLIGGVATRNVLVKVRPHAGSCSSQAVQVEQCMRVVVRLG